MKFRLLGPLEVERDGAQVPLGGPKQRTLLAVLLLARGRPVSTSRLIEAIWSGEPPATAHKSVQVSVSALRKALGADRIVTRGGGYELVLQPDELDVDRFDALVRSARDAAPAVAAATLREALSLARGAPLADVVLEPWAAPEIERLEERVLEATAARIDADLALGRHRELLPELEELVAAHPYREHFLEQLVLALYRSGRQADALAAYRRGGARLRDELGLEPGRALQQLERQMLEQDASLDPPRSARPPGRRSRRRAIGIVVAGALAAAVAAGAALAVSWGREPDAELASLPPGVAVLDSDDGRLIAHVPTTTIPWPAEAAAAAGAFWIWSLQPFSLIEVDSDSGELRRRIGSPFSGDVSGFVPEGSDVWFTGSRELVRVDATEGRAVDRFELVSENRYLGLGQAARCSGSFWVASNKEHAVLRVDPANGDVQARVPVQLPWAIACGEGGLWVTSADGLVRIDPATDAVAATAHVSAPVATVAVGAGFAWTADETSGTVYKVDPSGSIAASYETGEGARPLAFDRDTLWVGNQDAGTVTGIDTATGALRTFEFGHPVQAVAALEDRLAVVLADGLAYEDRVAGLEGDVLRLVVPIYTFDPPDPALATNPVALLVERATCATLLTPVHGADRTVIFEPEIAAAPPAVSPDRRTYTFTVRGGLRFAAPSGVPLTAEAVRFSVERALSPELGSDAPGLALLSDLVGLDDFRAGRAAHVEGIEVSGETISFTTTTPADDLPERLSLPFFCAVPPDTPIIEGGVRDRPPPSAGPFVMSDHWNGEYAILRRNPDYEGPRPARVDAIALREGLSTERAVGRVESGSWDGAILDDPALGPDGAAAQRAANSDAVRHEVLHDVGSGAATGEVELFALLSARIGCDDAPGALDLATACVDRR